MSGAVTISGKWRIKPSSKLPVFFRFMNNACFMPKYLKKVGIKNTIPNRVFVKHMVYWPTDAYNRFEKEIINHLKKDDHWYEKYCRIELKASIALYKIGIKYKKNDWSKKTNQEIAKIINDLIEKYREIGGPWYVQYPLDEFFEKSIEKSLEKIISKDDQDFRKIVLIFSNSEKMTEVAEERWQITKILKKFIKNSENFKNFSESAKKIINKHLEKFAYINRGLGAGKPYNFFDITERLREIEKQITDGKSIDKMIYESSEEKAKKDYLWALNKIKPKADFKKVIKQARWHSYLRNIRVESFFNADYGASFIYAEVAKRANFNNDWIMEVSIPEMMDFLINNKSLPNDREIKMRLDDYAMIVKNGQTTLITDRKRINKIAKEYKISVKQTEVIHGKVACLGGIIRGRAKICLDIKDIGKINRGDIMVAQFTTPDFVPAMEKAAAIVADQGGLSSHAAIVSRELGVPCVMATKNGTRIIRDNDLVEVDATKGIVKIIERAK